MHEINFNEIFSPTVGRESFHIFLAIAYFFGFIVKQINIVRVYLKSLLSDNDFSIFMGLPPGIKTFRFI